MNQFYKIEIRNEIDLSDEMYDKLVNAILDFRNFTIDDIYKIVNKGVDKKLKVSRYNVVNGLRILLKNKLIAYDLEKQLMKLNKTTIKK